MTEIIPRTCIRKRLGDLDTKGYYLLVALSFIYRSGTESWLLKLAFTLTALAVVAPVQDFTESGWWLKRMRDGKTVFLYGAMICALLWIWRSHIGTPN
jgi:hypothetical protein